MPEIHRQLATIVRRYADRLPADRVRQMLELIEAREPAAAFWDFCMYAEDAKVTIDPEDLEALARLGSAMEVNSIHWRRLADPNADLDFNETYREYEAFWYGLMHALYGWSLQDVRRRAKRWHWYRKRDTSFAHERPSYYLVPALVPSHCTGTLRNDFSEALAQAIEIDPPLNAFRKHDFDEAARRVRALLKEWEPRLGPYPPGFLERGKGPP